PPGSAAQSCWTAPRPIPAALTRREKLILAFRLLVGRIVADSYRAADAVLYRTAGAWPGTSIRATGTNCASSFCATSQTGSPCIATTNCAYATGRASVFCQIE